MTDRHCESRCKVRHVIIVVCVRPQVRKARHLANQNFHSNRIGGLGATYAVHLRLIRKLVGDFLLVIIDLFSLGAFVLSQYTRLTDTRTDGQTDVDIKVRSNEVRCSQKLRRAIDGKLNMETVQQVTEFSPRLALNLIFVLRQSLSAEAPARLAEDINPVDDSQQPTVYTRRPTSRITRSATRASLLPVRGCEKIYRLT